MYDHRNGCSFRKLAHQDLFLMRDLKQDSWPTTHSVTYANLQDQQKWLESVPANEQRFLCYRTTEEDGRKCHPPVGYLSVKTTDSVGRIGSLSGSIFASHRGTEWSLKAWQAGTDFAFEMFNFHRLEAEAVENNIAALGLDVKVGYKIEGVRKKAVYKCGLYLDSYLIGYLRDDWEMDVLKRYGSICNDNFRARQPASKVLQRLGVYVPDEFMQARPVEEAEVFVSWGSDVDGPDAEAIQQYAQAIS